MKNSTRLILGSIVAFTGFQLKTPELSNVALILGGFLIGQSLARMIINAINKPATRFAYIGGNYVGVCWDATTQHDGEVFVRVPVSCKERFEKFYPERIVAAQIDGPNFAMLVRVDEVRKD